MKNNERVMDYNGSFMKNDLSEVDGFHPTQIRSNKMSLTYDDLQIVPSYSNIESRESIDISGRVTTYKKTKIPVMVSPMISVSSPEYNRLLEQHGICGTFHRFEDVESTRQKLRLSSDIWRCVAVGVTDEEKKRIDMCIEEGVDVLLIDVAHGHHKMVADCIRYITRNCDIPIIAGNVVTFDGTKFLCDLGASGIRVGIGGGSVCSTRIKTSIGIPQATAIVNCVAAAEEYDVAVIADGGIRNVGDISKALGLGADSVMMGKLFAQVEESPEGSFLKDGRQFKKYYGSASEEAKAVQTGIYGKYRGGYVEGISTIVEVDGTLSQLVMSIKDGVRSAFSYVGARDMGDFHCNVRFVQVTHAGQIEATPHAKFIQ